MKRLEGSNPFRRTANGLRIGRCAGRSRVRLSPTAPEPPAPAPGTPSPVADRVLLLGGEFGAGPGVALRLEDGVVAEAVGAGGGVAQGAPQLALDDALRAVRQGERRRAGEVGAPVFLGDVRELGEEQVQVRAVVPVPSRPAGGEDAGGAVQDVHTEAGVVGDGGQAGGLGQGVRFEEGVLGEGDAGFLDVGDVRIGLRADEVVGDTCVGEDRLQLGDLSGVAGGEDQAGHGHQYRRVLSRVRPVVVTACRPWSALRPRR